MYVRDCCEFIKGTQQMTMTINVPFSLFRGTYSAEIKFTSATYQKTCVKITDIVVKKHNIHFKLDEYFSKDILNKKLFIESVYYKIGSKSVYNLTDDYSYSARKEYWGKTMSTIISH